MNRNLNLFLILLFSFVWLASSPAQNFTNGFGFYLPPQDTSSQKFLPHFPIDPIEANDFVSIDEHGHFSIQGKPIRFFGTNAVADAAFPNKAKAGFIAGRMRKMGFNLVRFHHLDNPWSRQSLFEWGQDTRHLNPVTLDRLAKFVSELKNNGIYINMNLHVSRTFNQQDGVPDADSIQNYGKGVTYFDPQLIDLQKEYARQLVTHTNPYTGLSLANDPVMAMVEITNENSLYRMWREGKLKPFSSGGDLIIRHHNMLNNLWQDFLLAKYLNSDSLRSAWDKGTRAAGQNDQLRDAGFEQAPIGQNWILEQHETARATMAIETQNPFHGNRCARVIVSRGDGINWHIQWKQVGLSIEQDSLYTVSFAGRSDQNRTITVSVMLDVSPWTSYTAVSFLLKPAWQQFNFSFRAAETKHNNIRVSFQLGREAGSYWFDEIHFTSSAIKGLEADESLEQRTVRRIDYAECVNYSDPRVKDMSAFYLKIQNDFFAEMVDYLKNELGVKVPIVGTNWNQGPADMAVQSQLDYIDNHSYWDHPQFPNIPWSSTDWLINNTPMVTESGGGTIPGLMAGVGLVGKPFTISEYNHAFPNRYQSEGVLFLTSYAAFHDVDGLMFFDYGNSSEDWETDKVSGYFAIHRNTAMMAQMPSCALAYRNHFIAPAQETIQLNFSPDDILLLPKFDSGHWTGPEVFPNKLALQHAVRNASFESSIPFDPSTLPPEPVSPYITDTGEIQWDSDGILKVITDKFIGITGFLNHYIGARIGNLLIVQASDFATLTWLSLTNAPLKTSDRSLFTLTTKLQNTGMIWDGTTTVHNNWGNPPTQNYPVYIKLYLNVEADSIRIYPLNPDGSCGESFTSYLPVDSNHFVVNLNQNNDKTVWFGLERFGEISSVESNDNKSQLPIQFRLEQNYPNPFNSATVIKYHLPEPGQVTIELFDIRGRKMKSLANGKQTNGVKMVTWDGTDEQQHCVGNGIYFCQLRYDAGDKTYQQVIKLVLVK